jgi:hypothetical protein
MQNFSNPEMEVISTKMVLKKNSQKIKETEIQSGRSFRFCFMFEFRKM